MCGMKNTAAAKKGNQSYILAPSSRFGANGERKNYQRLMERLMIFWSNMDFNVTNKDDVTELHSRYWA